MVQANEPWNPYTEQPVTPARYCLRCQELLPWYEQGEASCLKCGLQYDPGDPETFRYQRRAMRLKYWFPAFCLAVTSGILSYALLIAAGGEFGYALFLGVPVSVGAVLGYGTRVHIWALSLLGVLALSAVVLGLVSMHVAGFFCGATLGLVFVIPIAFGIVLGFCLRLVLSCSRWDQRWLFPLVPILLLPYGMQFVENRFPRRTELAVVRTGLTLDATPAEAWQAIMFYEEVQHDPPWLLRLALPRPIRSEGSKQRAGEVVRCFYDRGYLVKRISRIEPQRLLEFDVTAQKLHFERDVTLKDGSFQLIPEGDRVRIVLTTRYQRHLSPLWLWQPVERKVVHTLHGHVLEGIRRRALELRAQQPGPGEPYRPAPGHSPDARPPTLAADTSSEVAW